MQLQHLRHIMHVWQHSKQLLLDNLRFWQMHVQNIHPAMQPRTPVLHWKLHKGSMRLRQ